MAQTAKRATIAVYDGQVVISDIVKRKTAVPIFSSNETYSATLVTSWYDGSPMDDTKADGSVYFKLKALPQGADPAIYGQYVGSYFRVNLPKFGETFLEKDTMQAMRDLSPVEVLLLKMGYYKGVKLNGYYAKDDTPSPIEYYLSETADLDDGGSVIVVGDIKLEHDFGGYVDVRYFGVKGNDTNETIQMQRAIDKAEGGVLNVPKSTSNYLTRQVRPRSNTKYIFEKGVKWKATDDLNQTADNVEVLFRLVDLYNVTFDCNEADLYMNKSAYSSEHNHIFHIDSCDNIIINDAHTRDSGGDGFYITGLAGRPTTVDKGSKNHSSNIYLNRCKGTNHRRCGLSLVGVYYFVDNDGVYQESSGTSIEIGVDIEPELRNDRHNYIYFNRTKFLNNSGKGLGLTLQKMRGYMLEGKEFEVVFTDCYSQGNLWGYSTQYNGSDISGSIKFIRCTAVQEQYSGFTEVSSSKNLKKEYYDCLAIDCNTSNSSNSQYSHGASWFTHYSANSDAPDVQDLGGTRLYRCKSIETRTTPLIRRGISFSDTLSNGVFPQDIYLEDFESIGHTIEPIYIATGTLEARVKYNNKESKAVIAGTGTSNIALSLTGRTISNLGATGSKIYNLPIATKGLEFTFRVEEANQPISILPQSGTLILGLMRSTSSNVSSNVLGDYITVKAREDGNWDVVNIKGIWSLIDNWTTAQRPVSPKTGKEGYNTTLGVQEYYNGTTWVQNATTANATTTVKGLVNQLVNIANITTADATDEATAISLVNGIKAKLNSVLTEMKSKGTMVPDTP